MNFEFWSIVVDLDYSAVHLRYWSPKSRDALTHVNICDTCFCGKVHDGITGLVLRIRMPSVEGADICRLRRSWKDEA